MLLEHLLMLIYNFAQEPPWSDAHKHQERCLRLVYGGGLRRMRCTHARCVGKQSMRLLVGSRPNA